MTGFLIQEQTTCWDTVERDVHSCHTKSKDPNLDLLGWLCPRKVALPGGILVVRFDTAVAAHSTGSSAMVVIASEHWVSAYEAATVASRIVGAAFALAPVAGSSMVA
jgi:hypothetical protein